MINAGSLDRMLTSLADTPYGPDIEASLVRTRGLRRLDEAIRSNLARTLKQMASFYSGEPRDLVDLLLRRWDLKNLRSLLRVVETPLAAGDVSRLLVPAGRITAAELAELADQPGVRSRLDLMVAWRIPSQETATALIRARRAYETDGDTSALELALDNAFAAEMEEVLGEDDPPEAATILRAERDARNLGIALRLRAARLDQEPGWTEHFRGYVEGGSVDNRIWEEVADTDPAESIVGLLTGRLPLSAWEAVLQDWVTHADLTLLTEGLRRTITQAAVARIVIGDVLGFDVPVAFTFAKEAEARNLRLIGRGIVHGLPVAEIEQRLEVAA